MTLWYFQHQYVTDCNMTQYHKLHYGDICHFCRHKGVERSTEKSFRIVQVCFFLIFLILFSRMSCCRSVPLCQRVLMFFLCNITQKYITS